METFHIDKFVCGFFVGVILYFVMFNTFKDIHPLYETNEIDILQRISDKLDAIAGPESERDLIAPDLDTDLQFHHDKMTNEALELKESITISCYIITENCNKGSKAVNRTWGKRCNHIRFLVRSTLKTCGLPVLYLQNTKTKEKYKEAILKIYNTYANESDWTLIATDDNYVIMENVRYTIGKQSPEVPFVYGYIRDFTLSRINPRMYNKYSSTMVLSKAAMTRYVKKSRIHYCNANSTSVNNLYFLLCLGQYGIGVDTNGSKAFNIVPLELRTYSTKRDILHHYMASFRYVNIKKMYGFEYLVYHLRPYGSAIN